MNDAPSTLWTPKVEIVCRDAQPVRIDMAGKIVRVQPICSGSYLLTVGKAMILTLPGVPPEWMVPGAYVRFLFNQPDGTDRIELLGKAESEHFANGEAILEAQYANQNPFAAHHGTT